ncbi:amidohydrolase family protein [Nakamurella sp. A5-74]|uniref:Amidohydrolase family protein n=1 Tax=Nakamurella sp. A5-74 TaxID=3158264 RepID=A0AAU8DW30_9ACTN
MSSLVLTQARIVDVGSGVVAPGAVRIVDGRIAEVGPAVAPRPGEQHVDAAGKYVIPGLVTVHTHLSIVFPFSDTDEHEDPDTTLARARTRAQEALRVGATTVRCIHEQHRVDLTVRALAAETADRTVPRIVAGGRALSVPGGHGQGTGSVYCSGPEQFYAAAMDELDAGADHVKIFITGGLAHAGESPAEPEMSRAEMAAVVRAAAEHGTYVVAHAGHHTAIREALDAGVTSFEHAYEVDEQTADLLAQPGIFVSPTLIVSSSQATMRALGFEQHSRDNARRAAPAHLRSIRRLVAAGVCITHGTDYPPGQQVEGVSAVATEAMLLQSAGLSPLQVLQAATTNGARLVGLQDSIGAIQPGYAADLVLLDADPTADAAALARVHLVINGGHLVT